MERIINSYDGIVTLPWEAHGRTTPYEFFKPPRRTRATWSLPRRGARGEIELR